MTAAAALRPAKVRKPAYKPHIRKESPTTYTVQSETWTYVLYTVTVHEDGSTSCDCDGCATWGKVCKHLKAVNALLAYNAHPEHVRPAAVAVPSFTELAEQFASLPAPSFDFRTPSIAAPRYQAKGMQTCPGCGRTRWGIVTEDAWCACQQPKAARQPIPINRPRGANALREAFGAE